MSDPAEGRALTVEVFLADFRFRMEDSVTLTVFGVV